MKHFTLVLLVILSLALAPAAFGQATTTLSGTVADPSGALIPGVDVRATNNATSVERQILTNDAGVYNFPSLAPGVYTVRASLPSFQTQTFTDVTLSANQTNRLNFVLQIASQATAVEVAVSANQLLLESSPSVGEALAQRQVEALPNVTNNVLELINVMAGVTRNTGTFSLGVQGDFAGVSASNINVVRDGISVNDQRWSAAGLNSATYLNQDLVGEMRMILAPVDAETGRGNGQVQITTRSGGNEYHGAGVWNIRNSALDTRTWTDNRTAGAPPTQPWINQNQYTLSVGGPIIQNKTFFYTLYDQNISHSRNTVMGQVLSPCMQKGIFRYWEGWNNGPADAAISAGGQNPTRPSVDFLGNPLMPTTNPNGSAYTGQLRYVSLFGVVSGTPSDNNCTGLTVSPAATTSGAWDQFRTGFDTSGVYDLLASRAPDGNTWEQGGSNLALDGLNVIGHRWTRTVDGRDNLFGVGEPNPRKQINVKIDHVFTQNHRLATSYTYESVNADDTYEGWQDSFEGRVQRRPQVLSVNMTSTLSPSMVNEGRFGMTRQGTNVLHATAVPGHEELFDLLPTSTGGLPVLTQWCTPAGFLQPAAMSWCGENGGLIGARGDGPSAATTIDSSPRWTIADTLTWTSGKHAFKFGATYTRATSKSEITGSDINNNAYPVARLGTTALAPNNAFDVGGVWRTMNPALAPTNVTVTNNSNRMRDLLVFLSGSLGSVSQGRFINNPNQVGTSWNDAISGDLIQVRDLQQHEFNFFFKDDWKITPRLTLNLGMRWDYYGVPYDKNGMTLSIAGGSPSLFGRSGNSFADWFSPGERGQDVQFLFVGPNSPNPDMRVYDRDLNNFGPAVGFSYTVPWLGRDRTVIRGGYQLSYLGGGQGDTISGIIESAPGSAVSGTFTGLGGGQYFNMQDVVNGLGVPAEPSFLPVQPVPVYDHDVNLTVFDSHYVTPYVQNLTMSVTHSINSKMSVDVRYIGTLTRKMGMNLNLNQPTLFQNGLFDALVAARAGGESALLDNMLGGGVDHRTFGFQAPQIVGQNGLTGAGLLRTDTRFNSNLANGNFVTLANALGDLNYSGAFNPSLPAITSGSDGNVLRVNGFPENFIFTSPQFGNANLRTNLGYRNYHSMQSQFTIRPTYGVSTSFSYTWAKDLGNSSSNYTIPWDRAMDYRIGSNSRAHSFRSYGTFDLPIGPNQLLFANSSGILARVAEGWQMSWIYNIQSGQVLQVGAARGGFYNNSEAVLVDPSLFNPNDGKVTWGETDQFGSYFTGYNIATDPQCTNTSVVAASIQNLCNINALYSNGNLVFRTALPGELNQYRDHVFGPWSWTLDMAISKKVRINERMNMDVRMDATNIFNHPTPNNPSLSINGGNFGEINNKTGSFVQFSQYGRVFQLRARLSF